MSMSDRLKDYFYDYYDMEIENDVIEEIMHIVADDFIQLVDKNWTLLNRYMDERESLSQPYSFPEFISYLKRDIKEENALNF